MALPYLWLRKSSEAAALAENFPTWQRRMWWAKTTISRGGQAV